ncbi:MAG: DUF2339 domain-containing protein [Deltaproteobacteria bacterium]|nr:DUF2339 domain-containing protein [Deltaproteobacteria bacterium]
MEPLFALFVLAILAFLVIAPVFGLFGWRASRKNRRRLEALEGADQRLDLALKRIARLEEQVAAGTGTATATPSVPQAPVDRATASEETASAAPIAIADSRQEPPQERSLESASEDPGPTGDETLAAASASLPDSREPAPEQPGSAVDAVDSSARGQDSVPKPALPVNPPSGTSLPAAPLPPPLAASEGSLDLDSAGPKQSGPGIDWERWIGLRGAAVLGGIVLALAAVLFLKHSIEAGWIPPVVRVALAVLVGLAALVGSQALRARGYVSTANALAGAAVVILYAAVWAARGLYELIGVPIAYLLMILVTVVCGLLSWRYKTLVVAVLGLIGGFATPALLTSMTENPIGLFTYLLLLNGGLLILSRKRRWRLLALLTLAVTTLYQVSWIFFFMEEDEALIALVVLGVFALLYALGSGWKKAEGEEEGAHGAVSSFGGGLPWLAPAAGVFLAFTMTVYVSSMAALTHRLVPLAGLLLLLCLAAQWLGRVHRQMWFGSAAAAAAVGSLFAWLREPEWGQGQEWLVAAVVVVLAFSFHIFVELDLRRRDQLEVLRRAACLAAVVAAAGMLMVLIAPVFAFEGRPTSSLVWPWIAGWALLAALLVRQSFASGFEAVHGLAAAGAGSGVFCLLISLREHPGSYAGSVTALAAVIVLTALAFQGLTFIRRSAPGGVWAERAAALFPLLALMGLIVCSHAVLRTAWIYHGFSIVLAILVVLVATRLRSGLLFAGAVALLALSHLLWAYSQSGKWLALTSSSQALALQFFAVVLLTFWPSFAGRAFHDKRGAWYAAALAGPAWFFPMKELFKAVFGATFIGVLPLALAALSLASAYRSRSLWKQDEPLRKSSLVWFAAVTLGFISLAIPLQLDKEWITVGWALEGLALLWLWRRLDHAGLKYFALALFAAVTARLVVNPQVLGYHSASGVPVFNWLTYTYLIPAACLLGGAYMLQRLELQRLVPREQGLYRSGKPLGAAACGVAAILVIFAWINLSILDFFAEGSRLTWSLERSSARDLTTSLAWAIYAVVLLGFGIAKNRVSLRWISLAFLVLTIGKVFLYDLGELQDLYRVASLVGLAVSLILVSLVYQRFVFRPSDPPDP